jgi:hypothetical protein
VRPFPEVDAGRRRVSSGFGVEPVWSDAGEELFYRDDANLMSVAISDPETFVTGEERVLFPNSGFFAYEAYRAYDFDPASDGLLMIVRARQAAALPELVLVQNFLESVEERLGR